MAGRKTPAKKVRARPTAPVRKAKSTVADLEAAVRSLQRRLKQLTAEHEALLQKQERQLGATRRAADRQVSAMMRELVSVRHHEARAEALERLLAQRDTTIAALRIMAGEDTAPASSTAPAVTAPEPG